MSGRFETPAAFSATRCGAGVAGTLSGVCATGGAWVAGGLGEVAPDWEAVGLSASGAVFDDPLAASGIAIGGEPIRMRLAPVPWIAARGVMLAKCAARTSMRSWL